ncbi:MAG: protein adenylyltransferase SelO family protein [Polyangiaceae bacterium]|nr:protein adenylyltransferase SelO family protein [Polyangiaceae bacterium]
MNQNNFEKPAGPPSQVVHFEAFQRQVDYSFLARLNPDPEARPDGNDHEPREVFSGHYVLVAPKPLAEPAYVGHSRRLFDEIGLSDQLIQDQEFCRIFSGDLSAAPPPLKQVGWATGYALSIYGTEYSQQCPFGTGNGYGDGRAISVLEVQSPRTGKRWEMQLKGGGPTPYCRGADGRAVLRSSVREFLAQEFMHELGVPTSRSLTLFVSTKESVRRPWYSQGSWALEPDTMVDNPVAITTRVAPSFLRVGQLELFARRVRNNAHPGAREELRLIVAHAIEREYGEDVDPNSPLTDQVVAFARSFAQRLIELVGHWLRVGYCQGNFNSDNCALGGFTLDYGPFGFMEGFELGFQPWIGGGQHFSFFNQPAAAVANFSTFCGSLSQLIPQGTLAHDQLMEVRDNFTEAMQNHVQNVLATKLGLEKFDREVIVPLFKLLETSEADFTIFFRELSHLPENPLALRRSFAVEPSASAWEEWKTWFALWRGRVCQQNPQDLSALVERLLLFNPKYTWREWLVAPAYQLAARGDYTLIRELQSVFSRPYDEQSQEVEEKYYRLRPAEQRRLGGISHYSCSS